jgi:hypothetical protein
MSNNVVAHDAAALLDAPPVAQERLIIDMRVRSTLSKEAELPWPKTAVFARRRGERWVYDLPPGWHVPCKIVGRITIQGCDAQFALSGCEETDRSNRPRALAPEQFLKQYGKRIEGFAPPESNVDLAEASGSSTDAVDTAAPVDAAAGADAPPKPEALPANGNASTMANVPFMTPSTSDTNLKPADGEANLNTTEATNMASRAKAIADSGEVPNASDVASDNVVSFPSKLTSALAMERRGFDVFPLAPNSKQPKAGSNGFKDAVCDDKQIRRWWKEDPEANVGASTERFIVIDVDPRKKGDETFAELELSEEFPTTARAKTQGGGVHIYYALPDGVDPDTIKGGNDALGPGIDVKTKGGYVVAPGSTIDGRQYEWAYDGPIAPAPEWLIKRLQAPAHTRSKLAGKRILPEDDTSVALSREWLTKHAPTATHGVDVDNKAYKVAARFYDFGASLETIIELLCEWSDTHCDVPMEMSDINRVASSAGRNRQNTIGARHPSASGFTAEEIPEWPKPANQNSATTAEMRGGLATPLRSGKFYWLRADEAARRALEDPGEPLLENVMNCDTEAVMIGKPSEGKSFGVLDWFYHGAKGLPWAGNATKQGAYVFVAAEAQAKINDRIAALEKKYGPLGDTPLAVIPVAPDLAHGPKDTSDLIAMLLEIERTLGQKIRIVAIDTLNRALAGGDENSSKDMGAAINATGLIRSQVKCASLLVHHPGWDDKHGRGHSSLFGAIDTEMHMAKGMLKVTKFRDGAEGHQIRLSRDIVKIGVDPQGKARTSCTVTASPGNAPPETPMELTPAEEEVLTAIDDALADSGKPGQVFETGQAVAWVKESRKCQGNDAPISRQTVSGHLKVLSEKGHVKKVGRGEWTILKPSGI